MPSSSASSHIHRTLILAAAASSSLLVLLLIVFLALYLYISSLRRAPTLPFSHSPARAAAPPLRRFSHRHLRSATAAFSPSRLLGRGGTASVFLAVLPDGKSAAVKLLSNPSPEFHNELRVLSSIPPSPFVVSLLGYCADRRRCLLVYEYMCNGSLQEVLFNPHGTDLGWDRRFGIIVDVACALAFLHTECDPPVIHGDIKPSNVLLGPDFQAKLSDFGLSRFNSEPADDLGPDLFSQELPPSQELSSPSPQVDFAFAHQGSSSKSCKNSAFAGESKGHVDVSPKRNEVTPVENDFFVGDNSMELNGRRSPFEDGKVGSKRHWGRDWWWKQDGSGELCSKDYVREWIGSQSQICPSRNADWDDERKFSPENCFENTESNQIDKLSGGAGILDERRKREEKKSVKGVSGCKDKSREMREWWKEEYFAEISNKGSKRSKGMKWLRAQSIREKQSSGGNNNATTRGFDSGSGLDISFHKGWKKKRSRSTGSDMWSGDLYSKELSSTTTSMRGTVCYVAPEHGACGHPMEKADIYSFGVLILVIISGRRPLHVLSSPMQFERANLISWCRQLVLTGNVLELVDERMRGSYYKEQAILCINLALLCLQRMPESRPDSDDIVRILKGEMDLPVLPFEFSPSPPSKPFSRTRRKVSLDVD